MKSGVIKRPDAAFGITEQRLRDPSFLRREQPDQLPRGRARHFLEQRRAIVRRHFVQNPDDLLVRHRPEQLLLRVDVEVFKNIRRQIMRQDAEDDDLFVFRQVEDDFGDIRRRPVAKELRATRAKFARLDQFLISGSRSLPTMWRFCTRTCAKAAAREASIKTSQRHAMPQLA